MGEIVGGKYELCKVIGKGGMSVVYLAMDRNLNKLWAIKKVREDDEDAKTIFREAELLKELDHPALPRIVDVFQKESDTFIVMDYVAGRALNDVLKERGVIGQEEAVEWGKKLCQVLSYLHGRTPPVIYRDMKPGNIILTPEGELKLIDFGIARTFKVEQGEDTQCLGTRGYAAPEQFGGRQTDERTDIYSLGVTLYHLVTGKSPLKPPYEIIPIREWNAKLSEGLEMILMKCHHPNPRMRYQSAREVYGELCQYKQKEKRYHRKLVGSIVVFFSLILISCAGISSSIWAYGVKEGKLSENYEWLIQAMGDVSEREKAYYEAIDIKPGCTSAYEKLIELYHGNGFNGEREKRFIECVYANEKILKRDAQYGNLCFRIGSLYWNSKSSEKDRIKQSFPWYEKAGERMDGNFLYNKTVTKAYINIGRFYEKINTVISYDSYSDKEFVRFWEELKEVDSIFKQNKEELSDTRNMFYRLAKEAVTEFYQKFLAAGVKKKELDLIVGAKGEVR